MGSREREVLVEAADRGPLIGLVVAFDAAAAKFALVWVGMAGGAVACSEVWKNKFTLSAVG